MCDSPCTIHSASDLPTPGPSLTQTAAADQRPFDLGKLAEDRHAVGRQGEDPVDRVLDADRLVADDRRHQLERLLQLQREVLLRERELGRRERAPPRPRADPRARTGSAGARTSRSRAPVPSWRSYMFVSMSRTIGNSMPALASREPARPGRCRSSGAPPGVSGIDAPAIRASFGLHTPQAMTTIVGLDVAGGRAHAPDSAALDVDPEHLRVREDGEAPGLLAALPHDRSRPAASRRRPTDGV